MTLQDTCNVSLLLQPLLPEPVWLVLEQTAHRPGHAAATLQKGGLLLLKGLIKERKDYYEQLLGNNTTPTALTHR